MLPKEFTISNDIAELKADLLLEEAEGQLSLRVLYWFLVTHGDVLEEIVSREVQSQSQSLPKIVPRIRTYVQHTNSVHEFHYVNKARTFDEVRIFIFLSLVISITLDLVAEI